MKSVHRHLPGSLSCFLGRVLALAKVEALRTVRDKTSFSLIVLVPAFQVILFGFAVNLNSKNITVAIAGGTPSSQAFAVERVEETGYYSRIIKGLDTGQAKRHVEEGLTGVAIELGDDAALYDEADFAGEPVSPVVVYADGATASDIAPALAALQTTVMTHSLQRLVETVDPVKAAAMVRLNNIDTFWLHNPDRRTSWTILPALVGVIVMISMLMLGALTLAREREQGSWELLMVMPVTAIEVLIAKLSPYIIIAFFQILLVILLAIHLFNVPLAGSFSLLVAGALLLSTAHLVLGFCISALVVSQMQALQLAVAFYLPSILLSGFMFPFSGMPPWAQIVGNFLPLTHFVRFSRDVMLRGVMPFDAALHLVPVFFFLAIVIVFALLAFRRKLI